LRNFAARKKDPQPPISCLSDCGFVWLDLPRSAPRQTSRCNSMDGFTQLRLNGCARHRNVLIA